jgi:hypothetical protein
MARRINVRGRSWLVLLGVCALLIAPSSALAGNEAAPWSAPTWLDAGEAGGVSASGPSLAELANGSLVATWNEDLSGSTFPQMTSEPFGGSWSAPDSLSTTAMTTPQDAAGGVRTAVSSDGRFVSVWLTPDAADSSENDVVGVSGSVTPGDAPSSSPQLFGTYSADSRDGLAFQYPYTPQVVMSSDGTGSVEFTAVDDNAAPGTDKRLAAIEGGSPESLTTTPPIRDNPIDGSSDYDKFIPQLAVAPLDAAWTASTNDTEAMLATATNYATPADGAILYTTNDPLDWYSATATDLPMSGELTAAGVLPDGQVIVANDADDVDSSLNDYGISVWETGDTSAQIVDPDTGDPAGYPAVATFNDGSATIAYVDYDGTDGTGVVKAVTMSSGGVWGQPVTLSPAGQKIRDVTDAYGPDGTTYVAWAASAASGTSPSDGIYASVRLPGGSFPTTPDVVFTEAGAGATTPKIAVDQTGFATIVAAVYDPGVGERIAAFTHTNPLPPRLLTPPAITGAVAVGSTLSCSKGTWANQPTVFTYEWLRGGKPIAGATAQTYTVVTADAGQTLSCQVTATNGYGSALGTSAGLAGPAQANTGPGKNSSASPSAGAVKTGSGSVSVSLSCPATVASCLPVTLTISVVEELSGGKIVAVSASAAKHKKRTTVIGSGLIKLKPGQRHTATVRLDAAGRRLLTSHKRLRAVFTVRAGTAKLLTRTVRFTAQKTKRH